jgi:hypothetical protein
MVRDDDNDTGKEKNGDNNGKINNNKTVKRTQ